MTVVQLMLGIGAGLALMRAVRGPNLVDRIVALDLVLLLLAGGLAAHGARTGSELYVSVLIVVALVAFAGTVLVARFIQWRDGS
ncbi:MAG: monovalent cation/H+ antiporter complex subunit F [Acidimicrobiia bacterium]|nr:monovalent cation/H+ antiporter complex subunit F [Acidimicrobiia bacterium]MDX2466695.1 monovalent cation/H+ antiporter complex subunit F [Acidimicrobiia bacterium]